MTDRPAGTPVLRHVLLALATAAVLVAELPALQGMVYMWQHSPMYSYGWLVPAISLFLLWSQRDALRAVPVTSAPVWGVAVLAGWALLMIAGRAAGVLLLEQIALVAGLAGLVLLFLGRGVFAKAWAAIAYLLLAVPLWDGFTEPLHLRFQLLSAGIGTSMLQAIGIPVFREGTFIELPTMRIEVARACSGVNYLIAVLALGLPLAYLYLRAWWRRVALVAAALLIAAFSNSLRVALIAVLVHYDLGAPLHGPAHVLHGLFVSGIGHVALFVGLWWLSRGERTAAPPEAAPVAPVAQTAWRPLPLLAGTAVACAGTVFLFAYAPAPVRLAASLDHLPAQLGAWSADAFTSPTPPDWWTSADHELRRRYQTGGKAIDLFVGYYEMQQQAREVVNYRALALRKASRPADVPIAADRALPVNVAREQLGPTARLTVFWYEIDGHVETRPLPVKLRTLWNALRHGRTNGAIICLTAPAGDAAADQATLAAMTALARDVHAALGHCLPHRTPAPAGTAAARALQPREGGA